MNAVPFLSIVSVRCYRIILRTTRLGCVAGFLDDTDGSFVTFLVTGTFFLVQLHAIVVSFILI